MNRRYFLCAGVILMLSGCARLSNAWKLGYIYGNVCDENDVCDIVDIYSDEASFIDVIHVSRIKAEQKYRNALNDGLKPREGALFQLTMKEVY